MNLYISNITNDICFTIKCYEQASIRNLKEIVSAQLKTYPCLFHLIYNGRRLDEDENMDRTLQHANVKNESKLYFIMKLNPEKEILLEIKRQGSLVNNWNREVSLREWGWDGIRINEEIENSKYKVTSLSLSNNQLVVLPAEIVELKQLTHLYLGGNQLTMLPQEIGELKQLIHLYFTDNKLTTFPKEIGELKQLKELYLYNNQLMVLPLEIGELKQLKYLHLSDNQLTTLPAEIGELKHCKIMR